MMDNNNHNNNIRLNSSKEQISSRFNIATLNVRGLNLTAKQIQILNYMELYNIDILRTSETKINSRSAKFSCRSNKFVSYFATDDNNQYGSGVGIIVSKPMSKYIHKVEKFIGCVIYLDLFLKDRTKFRVIQAYLPANRQDKKTLSEVTTFIQNSIRDANRKQIYTVLMGDFNLSYEKYRNLNVQGNHNRDFTLMNFLDSNSFYDTVLHSKPEEHVLNGKYNTFIPSVRNMKTSRIDYIYTSYNLLQELVDTRTFEMDLFNTDHKVIIATFYTEQIFKRTRNAYLKQHSMTKMVFQYDKATKDTWDNFASNTDSEFMKQESKFNSSSLNGKWEILQKTIYD